MFSQVSVYGEVGPVRPHPGQERPRHIGTPDRTGLTIQGPHLYTGSPPDRRPHHTTTPPPFDMENIELHRGECPIQPQLRAGGMHPVECYLSFAYFCVIYLVLLVIW